MVRKLPEQEVHQEEVHPEVVMMNYQEVEMNYQEVVMNYQEVVMNYLEMVHPEEEEHLVILKV